MTTLALRSFEGRKSVSFCTIVLRARTSVQERTTLISSLLPRRSPVLSWESVQQAEFSPLPEEPPWKWARLRHMRGPSMLRHHVAVSPSLRKQIKQQMKLREGAAPMPLDVDGTTFLPICDWLKAAVPGNSLQVSSPQGASMFCKHCVSRARRFVWQSSPPEAPPLAH